MFRIFLKKKIFNGEKSNPDSAQERLNNAKNRRIYERYPVDQQGLTVLNDQDILVIRDISVKGFCSDVSDRAYERFELNDVYEARMRSHGEIQTIDIKVAWKREKSVGFELHEPTRGVLLFFKNLVRPIQLAHSLTLVDAGFMTEQHAGMTWYHGEDVNLHVWADEEDELSAWQLVADDQLIEWSSVHGIKTGLIKNRPRSELGILEPGEVYRAVDAEPDPGRIRFAVDLIAALPFPEREDLEKSLEEWESGSSAV